MCPQATVIWKFHDNFVFRLTRHVEKKIEILSFRDSYTIRDNVTCWLTLTHLTGNDTLSDVNLYYGLEWYERILYWYFRSYKITTKVTRRPLFEIGTRTRRISDAGLWPGWDCHSKRRWFGLCAALGFEWKPCSSWVCLRWCATWDRSPNRAFPNVKDW